MYRNKAISKGLINKRMNQGTYDERRAVINIIYEIKEPLKLICNYELPRITVRITEPAGRCAGRARMNDNVIWIPEDTIRRKYLFQVVLHELLHAVLGVEHNEDCKLMSANVQPDLSDTEALKLFLNYFKH